jgi:uncharacterized phage protein gp47/JayE
MADLQTKDFQTIVREQVAAIQGGSSRTLVDLTVGSVLRAIVEAYAAIALWLQGLILKVLAITRAATSTGADLDSFMLDYGLVRLSAVGATGQATFARFTPTLQAVVPIGAIVQSADGTQQYAVTIDTTNTAYNPGFGGYVIGAGITSVTVPIAAVSPGVAGNAAIGGINTLGQAIAGVDTVSNAAAIITGEDPETDTAFRARFVNFLASLAKATEGAISYAATSVQTGITCAVVENQDYGGADHIGYFYVVIDDGSGAPSSDLLTTIRNAVDTARGFTINFGVFGPVVVTANVSMHLVLAPGYLSGPIIAAVQAAITAYTSSLSLGVGLNWSRLSQIAYDASPAVVNVNSVLLNSATVDIAATAKQVIKPGTVTVTA